jgi:hypothetical protein
MGIKIAFLEENKKAECTKHKVPSTKYEVSSDARD